MTQTLIGTHDEARTALRIARSVDTYRLAYDTLNVDAGNGWTIVGRGATRIALLSPSGVCYKVVEYDSATVTKYNTQEFLSIMAVVVRGLLTDGVDVPLAQRFDCGEHEPVLAMEYLGAEDAEYSEAEAAWAERLGVFDTKPQNCRRRPDGTLVWIDLGFCDFYDPKGYDYF